LTFMTVEVENRSSATSPGPGTSPTFGATGATGRPGRLELPAEGSLRDGLLAAFAGILAHACRQDVHGSPDTALHEFRKSVRRARALVRLMEGFVGIDAHAELSSTLRDVHRATSELRDRQVVAGVLQGAQPDPGSVSSLVRELGVAMPDAGAPDVAAIAGVMVRGCLSLAELPRLLAGAMPRRIRWDAVVDGLARSFRRARRRLRAVEQHGDDEAVHGLRKRIKELDYQIELMSACGGERVRRRRKELDHLAEALGQLVDLFVLRDHAARHVAPGPDHARLLEAIAEERAARLEQVLAHARDVLDDRPRSYARRVVRSVRRRRG
jgi:CHAD domain-containing protein